MGLWFVAFTLFTVQNTFADEEFAHRRGAIQFLGGMNLPQFSSSGPEYEAVETSERVSPTFGATLEIPLCRRSAIETGALRHRLAIRETERGSGLAYSAQYYTIEIPLMVRYELRPSESWELDLGFGGFFEILPTETEITDSTNTVAIPPGTYPIDADKVPREDFGLKTSARARIPFEPGVDWVFEISYRLGFKNLNLNPGHSDHSRLLSALGGIRFEM